MTVGIFATISPNPEHRDAVERALRVMVEHSRAEAGNLRYDLFIREGDAPGLNKKRSILSGGRQAVGTPRLHRPCLPAS